MERRRQNVQNYGSSWIKPPGIAKSLYQQREEKRELEEHQESLRREALAQELAEAEAEGADELFQPNNGEGAAEEEVRDLDDDVPDADTTGIDEAEDSDEDDLDNIDNEDEEIPRGVLASRMAEDVYREALVRGEEVRTRFGDGGSTVDEEEGSHMLQEEDLGHETEDGGQEMDMDMDADLDADIPDAEDEEGYEHTDTEAELTSSDGEDGSFNVGLPPRRSHNPSASMVRSDGDGTQNSMDISSLMSHASNTADSSPQLQERSGFRGRHSGH
jgi:hypothetical protein